MEVYKLEGVQGESHNVGRCGISRRSRYAAGRAAPGMKDANSSESGKE